MADTISEIHRRSRGTYGRRRVFAEILRREIAAMSKKVAKAEVEWQRRCESEGYIDPPERLVVVRGALTKSKGCLIEYLIP